MRKDLAKLYNLQALGLPSSKASSEASAHQDGNTSKVCEIPGSMGDQAIDSFDFLFAVGCTVVFCSVFRDDVLVVVYFFGS